MIELSEIARDALEAVGRRPVLADAFNPGVVQKLVDAGLVSRAPRDGSSEDELAITIDGREWMTAYRRAQRLPLRPA